MVDANVSEEQAPCDLKLFKGLEDTRLRSCIASTAHNALEMYHASLYLHQGGTICLIFAVFNGFDGSFERLSHGRLHP